MKELKEVKSLFLNEPTGSTPLTRCASAILNSIPLAKANPTLFFIATDGRPDETIQSFQSVLMDRNKGRSNPVYVSIVACSNEERDVGYLNIMDSFDKVEVLKLHTHQKLFFFRSGFARLWK